MLGSQLFLYAVTTPQLLSVKLSPQSITGTTTMSHFHETPITAALAKYNTTSGWLRFANVTPNRRLNNTTL